MKRRRPATDASSNSIADLFAGVMIALLLILVMLWIQALADVYEIHRLKRLQRIFDDAFARVTSGHESDLEVDRKRGEITIKGDLLFDTGRFTFSPGPEDRAQFEHIRSRIAGLLAEIDRGFQESEVAEGLDAREHVEILVIGHTDCVPFSGIELRDNWDLSAMRAVSLAAFLTEPCDAPGRWMCCPDGSLDCDDRELGHRIDTGWRVLPVGRGESDPRPAEPGAEIDPALRKPCREVGGRLNGGLPAFPAEVLDRQRRVVIQIVPRMDKLIVRDWKE